MERSCKDIADSLVMIYMLGCIFVGGEEALVAFCCVVDPDLFGSGFEILVPNSYPDLTILT
jgi:hypothetical protein